MPFPLRMATLDVTPDEVEAIRLAAEGEGERIEALRISCFEELPQLLPTGVDVIVAAHAPPEEDVMQWLPHVCRDEAPPVVIVTEVPSEADANRLRQAGAFAVVPRGSLGVLARAVRRTSVWNAAASRSDLRRMSSLIRVIGHNLRGVLGGVTNAVEVLNFQTPAGDLAQKRTIAFLDRQCRRMSDLLDDYSELSRFELGSPAPILKVSELGVSLNRAVDRARLEVSDGPIEFDRGRSAGAVWLATEPNRLEQMVRHALIFVRRRSPRNEPVHLHVRRLADQIELVISSESDHSLDVMTGGGHEVDLDYFLSAVIAGRLGGHIEAGPPFVISLPNAANKAGSSQRSGLSLGSSTGISDGVNHVLIVDDRPESVQALGILIGRLGWNVRVTPDISEALQMVRQTCPAVVLIDLHMPIMDGQTLARLIRREYPIDPPLIVGMTGTSDQPEPDGKQERSFDHFLLKPVRREQIIALLPHREAKSP